jgi:hypothetical protein
MLIFASFWGTALGGIALSSRRQPVKPDTIIYVPQTVVHPK